MVVGLAQVLIGCVEYELPAEVPKYPVSEPPVVLPPVQTDTIVQVSVPVVDVLFTIDNSCSMEDEQSALSANFPRFMGYFVGSGLDYHVGVTATDLDSAEGGKLRTGSDGSIFIDTATADPEDVFTSMASLGTEGSPYEKGIGATYLAVGAYRDLFNAGFYREEASIHTVIISDEEDQTPDTIVSQGEFVAWYDTLKRDGDERTFSSIVHTSGQDAGDRYLAVTSAIGGITWDIAAGDWGDLLDRLGVQASGMRREYFLSQLPIPETIEVTVEDPTGTVLPFAEAMDDPPTDGWTYSPTRNSVTFAVFVPEPQSRVSITYTLLASQDQIQDEITTGSTP